MEKKTRVNVVMIISLTLFSSSFGSAKEIRKLSEYFFKQYGKTTLEELNEGKEDAKDEK